MAGRAATDAIIKGKCAISVNDPGHPLPTGWSRAPLTDVADLGTGHTPSRHEPDYWDGDIPWIGIRDAGANHGKVIKDTAQHVTELGLDNSAAVLLPKNTVCLSRTASVGYVVKMGRDMATSQDFVNWTCSEAIDPDYLVNALLAEGEDIRRFGEGSTHTTIYFPEVKAFHIDLPPAAEQRRIVAKLDALTARIARARVELDRVAALAEITRRSAVVAAFRGELTANWRERAGLQTHLSEAILGRAYETCAGKKRKKPAAKIEWRPDFDLPHGWRWASIDEIVGVVQYGTSAKTDDDLSGIPVLRMGNIQSGNLDWENLKFLSKEHHEFP
ncbi:restriction endonuclease subunit S [Jiella avicenniae]|uniref:Restriction endonuclease subunit S n=1 Tax=Jiella avicenniae TaxID=2907202 RepID=A0A9X1P128_9HYPH|nr:restriction endonuclease subunit S [Jiella avicenniae]MCE7029437.1 restriction endonuclease subunit S [Jiella avicenniae]